MNLEREFAAWADRRDPEALTRVFDGTAGRLLLLAAHLAGTGGTAEDLVQATFVAAMTGARSWDRRRGSGPAVTRLPAGPGFDTKWSNAKRRWRRPPFAERTRRPGLGCQPAGGQDPPAQDEVAPRLQVRFDGRVRPTFLLPLTLLACAGAPPLWTDDVPQGLARTRSAGTDTVVFFALPGREASDRMERMALRDPGVLAAMAEGGLASVRADGFERKRLYADWIGSGEGMGIAVVGADGQVIGARPGPQDAPELAAFLRLCIGKRQELAALRVVQATSPGPANDHALGTLLLQLGCRKQAEPLLLEAAMAGRPQAAIELALLYGQDGRLDEARRWLKHTGGSPAAKVVDGYVAFKERRHQDAVRVLEAALRQDLTDEERQRASLFLGKALHESGRSQEALVILRQLSAEATGSTFAGAALHTIAHIENPSHGHSH